MKQNKNIIGSLMLLSALFLVASLAFAHTIFKASLTCPICQTQFTSFLDGSGTSHSQRLDLKPIGNYDAPFDLPACPECGFVFYEAELDKDEVNKLGPFIQSPQYQRWHQENTGNWYRAARILEHQKNDPLLLANAFLKASWKEYTGSELNRKCILLSLDYFNQYLLETKSPEKDVKFIKGELLRQLGRFEEAKSYFVKLQSHKEFQDSPYDRLIQAELAWIDHQDAKPHDVDEPLPDEARQKAKSKDLTETLEPLEKQVSQNPFLRSWRRSDQSHISVLLNKATSPGAIIYEEAWKHAGLNGEPLIHLGLYKGDQFCAKVLLGKPDIESRLLVEYSHGCDVQVLKPYGQFKFNSSHIFPEYLLVDENGTVYKNTKPASKVECPDDFCDKPEPCSDQTKICQGSILFTCFEGKYVFHDLGGSNFTCGLRPDGKVGIVFLEGASCDHKLSPKEARSYCALDYECVDEKCVPIQSNR
jgi:tetratricopeptide (TPR) repeat protein